MEKTAILLVFCVMLAACGVKPGSVEPPGGAAQDNLFPRTYPDITTDPDFQGTRV